MKKESIQCFREWIQQSVSELGFFDLVEIPVVWKEIIQVLPEYLLADDAPDLELIWLFEGTGDDITDLFFMLNHLKEELLKKVYQKNPDCGFRVLTRFHQLEQKLLERSNEKDGNGRSETRQTVETETKEKRGRGDEAGWFRLLNAFPFGAVVFSPEGEAQYINKALRDFSGLTRKNLQSVEAIREIIGDDEQSIKIFKYFQRASTGEEFDGIEFSLKRQDGNPEVFFLKTVNGPGPWFTVLLFPANQHVMKEKEASAVLKDTFIQQAQIELQEHEQRYSKVKQQLHESFKIVERVTRLLKDDIDNFHTFANLLEEDLTKQLGENQDIKTMVEISSSLDEMMENLVEYAQLSLKRLRFVPVEWDAGLAVEEVFSHLEERIQVSLWRDRTFSFQSRVDKEVNVPLDFRIVTEILWQLTTNAFVFSTGPIAIKAKIENQTLVFSVEDEGDGVYEMDLERVFLPLVRLKPGSSKGLGLGLSIVKEYCKLSGYDVTLSSQPGKGTLAELWMNAQTEAE